MKFFKNKKGSELTEKILMTAFAVAMGASVIVYAGGVINNSKSVDIGMPVAYNDQGVEFIKGKKYTVLNNPRISQSEIALGDMEFVSVSRCFDADGNEILSHGMHKEGFVGYSTYMYNDQSGQFEAITTDLSMLYYFFYSEAFAAKMGWNGDYWNDNYPGLNEPYFDDAFYSGVTFEFSGTHVRQGNGPHLIDHLTYYNEE